MRRWFSSGGTLQSSEGRAGSNELWEYKKLNCPGSWKQHIQAEQHTSCPGNSLRDHWAVVDGQCLELGMPGFLSLPRQKQRCKDLQDPSPLHDITLPFCLEQSGSKFPIEPHSWDKELDCFQNFDLPRNLLFGYLVCKQHYLKLQMNPLFFCPRDKNMTAIHSTQPLEIFLSLRTCFCEKHALQELSQNATHIYHTMGSK